ncbi:uncharacterized protein PAC_00025 [Phialocephala subalpina]|uniref:Uncharacterized protein n=1 Tax=Phialocephala subalpina TaxID=576137 RepID=A0A1L7WBK3_9HELO|nr:uncharacterized protein PAC_00025 [Phialocephala subalpina]
MQTDKPRSGLEVQYLHTEAVPRAFDCTLGCMEVFVHVAFLMEIDRDSRIRRGHLHFLPLLHTKRYLAFYMGAYFSTQDPTFSVLKTVPPHTRILKVRKSDYYHQENVPRELRASESAKFVADLSDAPLSNAQKTLEFFFDSTLKDHCGNDEENMTEAKHGDRDCAPVNDGKVHNQYCMTMTGPPSDVLFANDIVDSPMLIPWAAASLEALDAQKMRPIP